MQHPCADVSSPYKRKCWTNSGGPLVNSVLWGTGTESNVNDPHTQKKNSSRETVLSNAHAKSVKYKKYIVQKMSRVRHLFTYKFHENISLQPQSRSVLHQKLIFFRYRSIIQQLLLKRFRKMCVTMDSPSRSFRTESKWSGSKMGNK